MTLEGTPNIVSPSGVAGFDFLERADTVNALVPDLERSGTGSGRIYTFTWEATNSCGATVTTTATVSVPRG